jgi:superfamily II DNA or RNA helicase
MAFKRQESKRGTICLSTGTGKSKVAIDFIKEETSILDVLITSPRTNLKENWRKELTKWGLIEWGEEIWVWNHRHVRIFIENVQTAYKWKDREFDFIIADEIHTMVTPEYSSVFEIKAEWIMGLTATHDITDKNDKQYYYDKYCPVIYEYYESAEDGLINKTRFFIVEHELGDHPTKAGTKKMPFMTTEAKNYEFLTRRIKEGQAAMMAEGSQDWFTDAANWFWNNMGSPSEKHAAMKYLNSIKARKEFLLSLSSTASLARMIKNGILASLPGSKVLIFSELTKQIERITGLTVHSHNSEEKNLQRIEDYNEGLIRELGSCQSLTLGLNLKGATHGIMESYVGSETRSKQKKGRLDRLGTDDVADMWFILVKGTQSEKWFESMVKGFDLSEAIYINSKKIMHDEFDYTTSQIK